MGRFSLPKVDSNSSAINLPDLVETDYRTENRAAAAFHSPPQRHKREKDNSSNFSKISSLN